MLGHRRRRCPNIKPTLAHHYAGWYYDIAISYARFICDILGQKLPWRETK